MVAHFDQNNWVKSTISLVIILPLIIMLAEPVDPVDPNDIMDLYCRNEPRSVAFNNSLHDLFVNLLSEVSSSKSSFFYSTATAGIGSSTETAYGLYFCPAIVTLETCKTCVGVLTKYLYQAITCANTKEGIGFVVNCMVRYSDQSNILSLESHYPGSTYCTTPSDYPSDGDLVQYDLKFPILAKRLFAQAAYGSQQKPSSFGSTRKVRISDSKTIYAFAQCTPDITSAECKRCLMAALDMYKTDCDGKLFWPWASMPSCQLKFQWFPFI